MSPAWRVGLPGVVLLLCALLLVRYGLVLRPLLATPPNPETPNLFPSEIASHVQMLGGLALLSGSGALLCFTLAGLVNRLSAQSLRLARLAGWLVRFVVLGTLAFVLLQYGHTIAERGLNSGGERAFALSLFASVLGLPVVLLCWSALGRLERWAGLALHWDGSRHGALQRQYRQVNGSWRLLALLLLTLGALLLPIALNDLPHPKAATVSTVLDKTVIAQQKPLQLLTLLALLSAGFSAWFTRSPLAETTARLDGETSRVGELLRQQDAQKRAAHTHAAGQP